MAIGQADRGEFAQHAFIIDLLPRPQATADGNQVGQPFHCDRRRSQHLHIGRDGAREHQAETVAAQRLHQVRDAGGDERVAHRCVHGAGDADLRRRLRHCACKDGGFLQRIAFGNPHAAKADTLSLLRFLDTPARIADPSWQDIGAELVEQRLRAGFHCCRHILSSQIYGRGLPGGRCFATCQRTGAGCTSTVRRVSLRKAIFHRPSTRT